MMKDFKIAANGSPLEQKVRAFRTKYSDLMLMTLSGLTVAYAEPYKRNVGNALRWDGEGKPELKRYNPEFFEKFFNPRHILRAPILDRMISTLQIKTRNGHSCPPIDRQGFFAEILPQLSTALTHEASDAAGSHYAAKNRVKRTAEQQKIIDGALALKALVKSDFGRDYLDIMGGIGEHETQRRQAHRARFERRCAARQKDRALRAQNSFAAATKRLALVLATPHLVDAKKQAPALTA